MLYYKSIKAQSVISKAQRGQFLLQMKQVAIKQRIRNKLQISRKTFPKFLVYGSVNACIVIAIMTACDKLINNAIPYLKTLEGETIKPHLNIINQNSALKYNHKQNCFRLYLINRILV